MSDNNNSDRLSATFDLDSMQQAPRDRWRASKLPAEASSVDGVFEVTVAAPPSVIYALLPEEDQLDMILVMATGLLGPVSDERFTEELQALCSENPETLPRVARLYPIYSQHLSTTPSPELRAPASPNLSDD